MLETLEDRRLMTTLTALSDSAIAIKNVPIAIDVLANDTIPDPSNLSVVNLTPGAIGTTFLGSNNTVIYTPNPDALGLDQFTYTIQCGSETATANVFVTISKTPGELYADYLIAVSQFDFDYVGSVETALAERESSIGASWATVSAFADQAYGEYLSSVMAYEETYLSSHDDVVTTFQEGALQARITANDRETAALDAHETAVAGPYADIDLAFESAAAQFEQAVLTIEADNQAAIAPFAAALDAAATYALANPEDPEAQTAWAQAEQDLTSAEAQAAVVRDDDLLAALALRESVEDAAVANYKPAIDAADAAFDAELVAANQEYDSAEGILWAIAAADETLAQDVFTSAEQLAWDDYDGELTVLNSQQAGAEASAQGLFLSKRTLALTAWSVDENSAWQTYVSVLATLPTVDVPGDRKEQPGVDVQVPELPSFSKRSLSSSSSINTKSPTAQLLLAIVMLVEPLARPPVRLAGVELEKSHS